MTGRLANIYGFFMRGPRFTARSFIGRGCPMPAIVITAAPRSEPTMHDLLFLSLGLIGFAALITYVLWCHRN